MVETSRWVEWEADKVTTHLHVDPSVGLSEDDAQKRYKKVGANQLVEGKRVSLLGLFIDQFKDFMVLVLLVATLVSGLLGEYIDAIAIIAIVLLNAALGFVQEVRAEKSLGALKKLSAPTARVLRKGRWQRIEAKNLVPGDIIYLESGDRIPADLRFLKTDHLYIEESALTGESVPVEKTSSRLSQNVTTLGDQKNMGYMGTMAVRGTGVGVVIHTGMQTEMGKIAHLLESTETMDTPLQKRLEQLGKILIGVSLFLTLVVVITGILHGHHAYKMFLAGVSLAVAAIPEGLPAIVTVALALGVQRMIKRKAIVRRLPSVETLGCATVICSDKTGTLTQNKMMVTHIYSNNQLIEITGNGYGVEGEFSCQGTKINPKNTLQHLMEIASLCNNASLYEKTEKSGLLRTKSVWEIEGDPTEGALLVSAAKAGITPDQLGKLWIRTKEFPFDSNRKMMSILVKNKDGAYFLYTKGAPDVLLNKCSHIIQDGKIVPLTEMLRKEVFEKNEELASMALRNLAFAYRDVEIQQASLSESSLERRLIFVGLMGMIDPPREEVKEAIKTCHKAGIKTIMITGDHKATALAIASSLGIKTTHGLTISGEELHAMSDQELQEKVEDVNVFARVSPEHKLRIVKALQNEGHIVAMTGDGVNDAPAIKAADIGISMGIQGTDVSKESSSLILVDDNFSTIVAAIEEGRTIYENIRKFISYLLASNVGEILIMFFAMLAGLPLPLVPIQILWVNLVTDGFPAMALAVDPAEENTMNRPPRGNKESVFARGVGWKIISRGLLIGICSLAAFWVSYIESPDNLVRAQTIAFATLVFAQLIYVFDCRSAGTIFQRSPLSNFPLIVAVLSSVGLLLVAMYYEPLQPIFHTVSLGLREWILILVTSSFPVLIAGVLDNFKFKRIAPVGVKGE